MGIGSSLYKGKKDEMKAVGINSKVKQQIKYKQAGKGLSSIRSGPVKATSKIDSSKIIDTSISKRQSQSFSNGRPTTAP